MEDVIRPSILDADAKAYKSNAEARAEINANAKSLLSDAAYSLYQQLRTALTWATISTRIERDDARAAIEVIFEAEGGKELKTFVNANPRILLIWFLSTLTNDTIVYAQCTFLFEFVDDPRRMAEDLFDMAINCDEWRSLSWYAPIVPLDSADDVLVEANELLRQRENACAFMAAICCNEDDTISPKILSSSDTCSIVRHGLSRYFRARAAEWKAMPFEKRYSYFNSLPFIWLLNNYDNLWLIRHPDDATFLRRYNNFWLVRHPDDATLLRHSNNGTAEVDLSYPSMDLIGLAIACQPEGMGVTRQALTAALFACTDMELSQSQSIALLEQAYSYGEATIISDIQVELCGKVVHDYANLETDPLVSIGGTDIDCRFEHTHTEGKCPFHAPIVAWKGPLFEEDEASPTGMDVDYENVEDEDEEIELDEEEAVIEANELDD